MALSPVQREAVTAAVHSGQQQRQSSTRTGTVVSVDQTNRIAHVSANGPDPTPHPADVIAPVQVWPGDVVTLMYTQPHGCLILGRLSGDWDDWHIVGEEGEPAFTSGWQPDAGTGPPSFNLPAVPMFTRRSGRIELRGRAERVSGVATTVFVLPENYWPDNDLLLTALSGLGAHTVVTIDAATGSVVVAGGVTLIILDGVSFLARAPRDMEA